MAPAALAACMPSMISSRGGLRQRGEDAAGVEPAHAAGVNLGPVEVARLEQGAGFVGPVVEDDRRPHAVAAVAVDRGDVGAAHAVVLEPLVKRRDARFAHAGLHQLADRVLDHGRGDAGFQPEAIGQVGGDVVFAARDVDVERAGLCERGSRPDRADAPAHPKEKKSSSQASFRIANSAISTLRQSLGEVRQKGATDGSIQ